MFDEVVKDASGGNKKTLKSDFLDKGEFVIVDQGQSKIAGYTNNKELLVKELPPYVVFGDHTRAFKYIDVPFAMGADGTKVLKPKNRGILLEKYLYYFFLTLDIPNTGYNRHFKYLKELKIPLPSIAEQQKIAAILDAADSLRQKDQQLVERYTALSQSLFLEMFGDPETNSKRMDEKPFSEVLNLITYGLTVRPEYIESGIPLISAREIRTGKINFETAPKISKFDFEKLSDKAKPTNNDILFSKTGSIGHCALVQTKLDFAISQNAARLSFNNTVKPVYVLTLT